MTTVLGILFGIAFLELVIVLNLQRDVLRIRDGSRDAFRMLASSASDEVKEKAMRRASLHMFGATGLLVLKFLVVGAVLSVLYWVIIALFPEREAALQATFVSPSGLAILTVATLVYAWIRHVALKRL